MSDFQDEPVEDGASEAQDSDRVDGILEQLRADIALGHVDDPRTALAQRLLDAGYSIDADELDGLIASL